MSKAKKRKEAIPAAVGLGAGMTLLGPDSSLALTQKTEESDWTKSNAERDHRTSQHNKAAMHLYTAALTQIISDADKALKKIGADIADAEGALEKTCQAELDGHASSKAMKDTCAALKKLGFKAPRITLDYNNYNREKSRIKGTLKLSAKDGESTYNRRDEITELKEYPMSAAAKKMAKALNVQYAARKVLQEKHTDAKVAVRDRANKLADIEAAAAFKEVAKTSGAQVQEIVAGLLNVSTKELKALAAPKKG